MNIDWSFEELENGTRMRWVQDFSMKPEAPASNEQAVEYLNKNTKEQMRYQGAARGGRPRDVGTEPVGLDIVRPLQPPRASHATISPP